MQQDDVFTVSVKDGDVDVVELLNHVKSKRRSRVEIVSMLSGLDKEVLLNAAVALLISLHRAEGYHMACPHRRNAVTDHKTDLPNSRAFMNDAEAVFKGFATSLGATPVHIVIIVLDFDCFKLYNDTFGHPVGDIILRDVASCLLSPTCRTADDLKFYRNGGDEFFGIFLGTLADACVAIERVRGEIGLLEIPVDVRSFVGATVSIGVASTEYSGRTLEGVLEAADEAMYYAKSFSDDGAGRNRVACKTANGCRLVPVETHELPPLSGAMEALLRHYVPI